MASRAERRRSMSKREAERRTDALIATMQRLSREGKEPAVLESYPPGEGDR
jgi:hypothetical protein